jgi:hypothetical protein
VLISPSGRYLSYIEEEGEGDNKKTVGKVVELVMNKRDKTFSLLERRTIEDFKERYDKEASSVNTYDYSYGATSYFITDKMEFMYMDKGAEKIMYEDINFFSEIKDKFGMQEYDPKAFKTLNDINVVPKNGGYAFYSQEEVWFVKFDAENKKVMPLQMANFHINKGQMSINKVCKSVDPNLIIIDFCKDYKDHLILVWDMTENREKYNFSTDTDFTFINGPGSKSGYILNGETYVNLDTGLINYFFEYTFTSTCFYDQDGGFRINRNEDIILEYGDFILKETLIEVASLDEIISGYMKITEANINIERVRFQVEGNTSLHYYALEYNTLKLILDYMEEHKPKYLTAILMKNNKGKSPLDISLDNESPKNTELFLRKLSLFEDSSLSVLFYNRFPELLAMNITAFHEYMDSCFFQTVQMAGTKYLKLKKMDDPWLVPHSSCLIDEVFIDKYCKGDEKKELEEAKKKKEEEDKKRAEEEKVKEEQKRKEEEEKKNNPDGQGANMNSIVDKESDEDMLDEDESITKTKSKEELEKEKERRKQKRLDIRAIEFDWIFNKKEGVAFIKTLSQTDCIDLFSLTLIRHIIRFLWSYYKSYIFFFLFIPFCINLTIFILYATWIHKRMEDNNYGYWENFGLANSICLILMLLLNIYFGIYEVRQMLYHKMNYFLSFWNLMDLGSLILNTSIII